VELSLDALFSGLVLVVVVATLLSFLYPAAYGPLSLTREHQLEDIAKAALDKILLTPGYPTNWGSDIFFSPSSMTSFGLAREGSGFPFDLDLDKVMRLANSSEFPFPDTLAIDPLRVATLLGLRSEERYGFMITITPALNISAEQLSTFALDRGKEVPSNFDVQVLNYARRPAAAAKVTVLSVLSVVSAGKGGDLSWVNSTTSTAFTDWRGRCLVNNTQWLTQIKSGLRPGDLKKAHVSIMIFAEYHGITSATVFDFGEMVYGSALASYLFIQFEEEGQPSGAVHVLNMTEMIVPPYYVLTGYLINETNGQSGLVVNAGGKSYRVYRVSSPPTDEVAVAYIIAKTTGDYFSIAFMRPPGYICYRTGAPSAMKTAVLDRVVKIGALHFVFELKVWREAET